LLREQELTLTKAESICRAAEVSEQQMKTISADMTSMAVNAIKKPSQEEENKPSCRYCGKKHAKRQCPAYGQICSKCQKKNNFAAVCQSK
jgi:hypothetical protein